MLRGLEQKCRELGTPFVNILDPVFAVFQSYLNVTQTHRIGGQHEMDAEYFSRMEALNYTMMHDDGQIWDDLESADTCCLGFQEPRRHRHAFIWRTAASGGECAAGSGHSAPRKRQILEEPDGGGIDRLRRTDPTDPPEQSFVINSEGYNDQYVDRKEISREINMTRRLCSEHNWPLIDVTRRSIEETAAEILTLFKDYKTARENGVSE